MSKCTDRNYYGGGEPTHDWEAWVPVTEGGFVFYTRGPRIGHLVPFTHSWQERRCKECGTMDRTDVRQETAPLEIFRK